MVKYHIMNPKTSLNKALLKVNFANDSNSLDRSFYSELLHIIGLTETKQGAKKLIERKKERERNAGSLLENAVIQLESLDKISRLEKPEQFGETYQERLFNVGLELTLTWINRVLFLKLLEAQLIAYHSGDKSYSFLNLAKVKSLDDLNSLFFQVLARKTAERNEDLRQTFAKVPYLNSSLFEPAEIEHKTLFISNLRNEKKLPLPAFTVLKDSKGKKRTREMNTLEYLFEFLDAYNFSAEGSGEIQEEKKSLINASVLGLIFEKINGYKDGSFFTPGFITMYMCRETIRRAVVQKFNERKGWKCRDLDELYEKIEDRHEANEIINSLKICDPAVGSGHFLVSALNEIIAVKSYLKILQDRNGMRLKEYHADVANDELIVTDEDGELFEYNPLSKESQRVQETLFHEKQMLIENCLFGVDINPNSVKICCLRLWIELLKNAYYLPSPDGEGARLETLPNIDINIKCGNSLISRFALDADLKQALRKSKWSIDAYRIAVQTYRQATSKEEKRAMEKLIADIKKDFRAELGGNNPKIKRLDKLSGELYDLLNQKLLFEESVREKKAREQKQKKLENEINRLSEEIEDIKSSRIYEKAFEWRFEFPEALNDDGDFVGFDAVIGNPPYGATLHEGIKKYFIENYSTAKSAKGVQKGSSDTFSLFIEMGYKLLRKDGSLHYIVPLSVTSGDAMTGLHRLLESNCKLIKISSYAVRPQPVFDNAVVNTSIIFFEKSNSACEKILLTKLYRKSKNFNLGNLLDNLSFIDVKGLKLIGRYPKISEKIEQDILKKLFSHKMRIGSLMQAEGSAIYYRTTGGRYFKVITNYSTGSTKEKPVYFDKKDANIIGAIMSSNLFFWFYQLYSNNLDLKSYEIESFPVPTAHLDNEIKEKIENVYTAYLADIERNATIRKTDKYANITTFREYKIGKSKSFIDKIDDFICPLYGLTPEETDFIKNYEINFRLGENENDE